MLMLFLFNKKKKSISWWALVLSLAVTLLRLVFPCSAHGQHKHKLFAFLTSSWVHFIICWLNNKKWQVD